MELLLKTIASTAKPTFDYPSEIPTKSILSVSTSDEIPETNDPNDLTPQFNLKPLVIPPQNRTSGVDVRKPYLERSFCTLIIGQPNTGKSTLLFNLITTDQFYGKKFDRVLVIAPDKPTGLEKLLTDDNYNRQFNLKWIYEKIEQYNQINKMQVQRQIHKSFVDSQSMMGGGSKTSMLLPKLQKPDKPKTDDSKLIMNVLLVFDDQIAQIKSDYAAHINKPSIQPFTFRELVFDRRHKIKDGIREGDISILITAQKYRGTCPLDLRNALTSIYLMKPTIMDLMAINEENWGYANRTLITLIKRLWENEAYIQRFGKPFLLWLITTKKFFFCGDEIDLDLFQNFT